MIRHLIHVHAPIADVFHALDRYDFASALTDGNLHIVKLSDGVGSARNVAGGTEIDVFDEEDGIQVGHLVGYLRKGGMVVDQETLD